MIEKKAEAMLDEVVTLLLHALSSAVTQTNVALKMAMCLRKNCDFAAGEPTAGMSAQTTEKHH
jgi:hypothetical protein